MQQGGLSDAQTEEDIVCEQVGEAGEVQGGRDVRSVSFHQAWRRQDDAQEAAFDEALERCEADQGEDRGQGQRPEGDDERLTRNSEDGTRQGSQEGEDQAEQKEEEINGEQPASQDFPPAQLATVGDVEVTKRQDGKEEHRERGQPGRKVEQEIDDDQNQGRQQGHRAGDQQQAGVTPQRRLKDKFRD